MEGGTETGFNIWSLLEDTPHLYRVWYAHVVTQVDLSRVLFRKEMPLFSLPTRASRWLWNGKSANPDEKAKG
jgi:hypothetical protein